MKPKLSTLIISLALIAAGVLFMAQNLGYIPSNAPTLWMAIFGGAGALFLVGYLAGGLRQWGLLFPALIGGALAVTIGMGNAGLEGGYMGTPILAAIALPFFVAFALNPRQNWWALIPGIVLGVVAVVPAIADRVPGELIGTLVLFGIALPFLIVFISDPSRRWALIPALVLGVTGLIPLAVVLVKNAFLPVFILLVIALPFLAVFLYNRRNWWAILPAGFIGSIGLAMLLVGGADINPSVAPIFTGLMFLGWAATFGVLYLLRAAYNTRWAAIPAAVLGLVGVVSFLAAPALRYAWPVILIVLGLLVVLNGLRKPKVS